MKTSLSIVFLLIFLSAFLNSVSTSHPPQLIANETTREIIVRPHQTVVIDCPVRYSRSIIFEWYKERINIFHSEVRIKILTNGGLRIKDTVFSDTGVYQCRAINGFGVVQYNTTLLVIGKERADYEYVYSEEDEIPDEDLKIYLRYRPRILHVSEKDNPVYKQIGDSFKLKCVATGYPAPDITWYKDGYQITHVKTVKWALPFSEVILTDSGNYTCVARNSAGRDSYSFFLIVDQYGINMRGRPVLTGGNLTIVEEGHRAIMECSVQSVPLLHVEWLKKVNENDESFKSKPTPLRMEGEYFNVISKNHKVESKREGTFNHHKLIIENTQLEDGGKYVCLGANTHGYEYRFVYLEVIRKHDHFEPSYKFPIVVTIIAGFVFGLVSLFAFLLYCRPRHSKLSYEGSTEASVDAKEESIPMQPNCVPLNDPRKHGQLNGCIDGDPMVIYSEPNNPPNTPVESGRSSLNWTTNKSNKKKITPSSSYVSVPT